VYHHFDGKQALAEAPEADRPRQREEWRYLIRQPITGLQAG